MQKHTTVRGLSNTRESCATLCCRAQIIRQKDERSNQLGRGAFPTANKVWQLSCYRSLSGRCVRDFIKLPYFGTKKYFKGRLQNDVAELEFIFRTDTLT